jgi:hypothetical protein
MNILSLTPRHLIFRKIKEPIKVSNVKDADIDVSELYSSWKDKMLSKEGRFVIRGSI